MGKNFRNGDEEIRRFGSRAHLADVASHEQKTNHTGFFKIPDFYKKIAAGRRAAYTRKRGGFRDDRCGAGPADVSCERPSEKCVMRLSVSMAAAKGLGLHLGWDSAPARKFFPFSRMSVLRSNGSLPARLCGRSRFRRPWVHGGVDYLDAESIRRSRFLP